MFWMKQWFYTSATIFGFMLMVPYTRNVLAVLFLFASILLTWLYYNQPVDMRKVMGNRHRDLRPIFTFAGGCLLTMGYFGEGPQEHAQFLIALGLGIAALPAFAVQAFQQSRAERKGYPDYMSLWFLVPSVIGASAAGFIWVYTFNLSYVIYSLVIGQILQLFLAAVFDQAGSELRELRARISAKPSQ